MGAKCLPHCVAFALNVGWLQKLGESCQAGLTSNIVLWIIFVALLSLAFTNHTYNTDDWSSLLDSVSYICCWVSDQFEWPFCRTLFLPIILALGRFCAVLHGVRACGHKPRQRWRSHLFVTSVTPGCFSSRYVRTNRICIGLWLIATCASIFWWSLRQAS